MTCCLALNYTYSVPLYYGYYPGNQFLIRRFRGVNPSRCFKEIAVSLSEYEKLGFWMNQTIDGLVEWIDIIKEKTIKNRP